MTLAEGIRLFEGEGASIDERPYRRPPARFIIPDTHSTGLEPTTRPIIWADRDLGVFARLLHPDVLRLSEGPFASRHTFSLGLASRDLKSFGSYVGTFRRVWSGIDARLALEYSELAVTRFRGFGNGFALEHPSSFYKVQQSNFVFAPALEFHAMAEDVEESDDGSQPLHSELGISLGPVVKWSNTPLDSNREYYIGSLNERLYGTGSCRSDWGTGQNRVRGAATNPA